MLFTFIQLLNSIEDQTKCTVRTLSKQFILIKNIISLLADRFILDAKQVHFASTKIIHFTNLLIGMRDVDILGSVITVMGNRINAAVGYLTSTRRIVLVDELSVFFRQLGIFVVIVLF